MSQDLALVMPVYNEAECIASVVAAWRDMLSGLGISFRLIVLNDGSRDNTAEALAAFSADARIEVITKPNSGHGPTILAGYRKAVESADWVFQCDSDNEIGPEHFPRLWEKRQGYDALFGIRANRSQHISRRLISAVSRLAVRSLFGSGIRDVNIPYRLIRAKILDDIVQQIPGDTFAPNVIISGALNKARVRIFQYPVEHRGRATGTVSIAKWKLWKAAARALWQTIRCRPSLRIAQV